MTPEWRYGMFLINVAALTICILSLITDNTGKTSQIKSKDTKRILLWNTDSDYEHWGLPNNTVGPEGLRDSLLCPTYDCLITKKKNFLKSVDLYDAIVFHQFSHSVPSKRSDNQLFVLALKEAPPYTEPAVNQINDYYYNLTMTYRVDSDIIWSMHSFIDIETNTVVSPMKRPAWRNPPELWDHNEASELWSSKSRDAAWFVTQCYTSSQREKVFESLQRYLDVDLYGTCGSKQETKFTDFQFEKYKYYLAFENALCTDFVSEDFFFALENGVLPIVFGGANYAHFAPPHSYINVEDFKSLEALAKYLNELNMDSRKYLRYFWWRQYYRLANYSSFCDLCEELHSRQEKVQTYKDIGRWWFEGNCRFETKVKI